MDGVYTQETNLGWIETDLGKDHLLLLKFAGTDRVNGLFDYRAEVLARKGLDPDALLGTHATVQLETVNHGACPFDGIVTAVEWMKADVAGDRYALELRPWFWLAGRRRQQRIFHEMPVNDILEQVLGDWSSAGPETHRLDLNQTYPELEYTVQYRESDLAFACRLMECFGISYHFEHEAGNHCLVLTDSHEAMGELPDITREYRPVEENFRKEEEHFWDWRRARHMTTGKIKLADYNFKKPGANQVVEQVGDAEFSFGDIESYDYPTGIEDTGVPGAPREPNRTAPDSEDDTARKALAQLRTTQERSEDVRAHAAGDVISLKSGMRCTAHGPFADFIAAEQHLCLEARHEFTSEAYRSGASDGERAYEGHYVLTPVSAPFAPVRATPQPIVQGPQTARVVGEGEIDCDKYGRILVRFHWDLTGAHSMRCRVSQNWAGKGWGGMVIPRIGMEVVVEFIEGNPDKPLVTGCVYNGKNDVPWELPKHKTRSTFRTDTHQGKGFNELYFEDEKDEEKIYLHAQKDHEIHVENNRAKRVDRNQSESVGNNKSIEVGNNHHEVIGGNMTLMVGPNKLQSAVTGAFTAFTGKLGDLANKLGLPDFLNMGEGNLVIGVAKNKAETVMLSSTEMVGAAKALTVGGGYQVTVGGIKNESVAIGSWEEVGNNKVVHVGEKFELVVGKSKLVMDRDGNISLEGVDIKINGSSSIKATAGRIDLN
ncbi:type VI secretion system Vgr family protein [Vannielia sp. SX4]|uniref:type VI secretion system Vgr family protein n=1 Tax=Vannielia sp. SX4 TaxID=3463852 RepID=UPI00405A4B67